MRHIVANIDTHMAMRKIILIFVTIVLPCLLCARNDDKSTDALLRQIDGIIKNRQTYGAEKEARIADLKKLLSEATSDEQRYGFCGRLFDEYRAYNLDSSYVYAQRKQNLASHMGKQDYLDDSAMNMAEVMGTTGMYKEALEQLGQIDKKTLPDYLYSYYYHLYRTIYGLMGDYAVTEKEKKAYYRMTDLYRDSLLQINASDSLGHVLVMADKCIVHAQYDEAIRMLMDYYRRPSMDEHSKAMITYTLSEGYRLKGDKKGQKHYLALSAIADLKSAVKEYVSLRKLASLVYEDGDIDRAYNYLKCSLEDATLCNARLRTLEISQVFPIIDQAYQLKAKRQQQEMKISLICISLLSIFLLVAVFFVYKQMKKVAAARREVLDTNTLLQELNEELHHSNSQLKEMNHTLSETNYIKEEYIGRYMDQCSTYLDKMDLYRRSLNKTAAAGKVEELYKAIKSSQFLEEELKEFYANFDMTFLQLFPNFVEEFNALLVEPMQPKAGELLNTELRIFALIRLGITDSTKIAQFLRYSVTTIYNYRTRVRNKALGERDEFEAKVMKIGKVEEKVAETEEKAARPE